MSWTKFQTFWHHKCTILVSRLVFNVVILSTASRRLAEFHGYKGRRYQVLCHVYNNTNITTQASCPRPRPGSSPGDWNCRPPSSRSGAGLEQGGQSSCTWACRDSGHRGGLWWRRVRTVCHTYRAAEILHLSCDCQLVSVSMSMNLSLMLSVHLYFLKINLQKIFSLPKSYTIL